MQVPTEAGLSAFEPIVATIGGNDKLNTLKESDFFILLTRYKNEGQPISIIEAAANGLKVISTNHAGIGDILSNNYMICVDKNNIELQKILIDIDENYKNRSSFIDCIIESRKNTLNNFSESNYLNELEKIFNMI